MNEPPLEASLNDRSRYDSASLRELLDQQKKEPGCEQPNLFFRCPARREEHSRCHNPVPIPRSPLAHARRKKTTGARKKKASWDAGASIWPELAPGDVVPSVMMTIRRDTYRAQFRRKGQEEKKTFCALFLLGEKAFFGLPAERLGRVPGPLGPFLPSQK